MPQTAPETQYSPDPSLTAAQHQVVNLLAQGRTITEAAAALNLHRNTIGNWNRCVPAFARELAHATREQSLYWHEQATQLAPKAMEIICTILHNEQASPSLRFRAALAIVKMAADPNPKPPKPFPTLAAEMDACNGQVLAASRMHNPAQTAPPQPAPQPVRVAPQPGRNSPCPCGSNQKYKRCCANRPLARTA